MALYLAEYLFLELKKTNKNESEKGSMIAIKKKGERVVEKETFWPEIKIARLEKRPHSRGGTPLLICRRAKQIYCFVISAQNQDRLD